MRGWGQRIHRRNNVAPPGNQAANGENKCQPAVSGETGLLNSNEFCRAEGYHQKYLLRSERNILREFSALYPAERDLVDSTAAARINGYLDGYGTLAELKAALPGFGLSPQAGNRLAEIVKRRPGRTGCKI